MPLMVKMPYDNCLGGSKPKVLRGKGGMGKSTEEGHGHAS